MTATGPSVSTVCMGSSMTNTGFPVSRYEPTNSFPAPSITWRVSQQSNSLWFSMANLTPASTAWLRTARRTLIMVSTCLAGGPGGKWSRSPASSVRTRGDPMPAARWMLSRSSFTERSNSLAALGSTAGSTAPPPAPRHKPAGPAGAQPQAGARRRVFHGFPVGRIVGTRVDGVLQKDRVQLQGTGILNQLEIVPAQGANRVRVVAQRKPVHAPPLLPRPQVFHGFPVGGIVGPGVEGVLKKVRAKLKGTGIQNKREFVPARGGNGVCRFLKVGR